MFAGCDGGLGPLGNHPRVVGCPAGLDCVTDPLFPGAGSDCEYPCNTTADCSFVLAICREGHCIANACGSDGGPPASGLVNWNVPLGQLCTGVAANDSTCLPLSGNDPPGACEQGGTATVCPAGEFGQPVDLARCSAAGSLCKPGSVCAQVPDGGGNCFQLCVPGGAATCPSGTGCTTLPTGLGFCLVDGGVF